MMISRGRQTQALPFLVGGIYHVCNKEGIKFFLVVVEVLGGWYEDAASLVTRLARHQHMLKQKLMVIRTLVDNLSCG